MTKKWYVLHTYSGYENKVKKNLENRIEAMGLENNVSLSKFLPNQLRRSKMVVVG